MSQEEDVVLYERETPPGEGLHYTETPAPAGIASCVRSLWHLRGKAGGDDDPQPVVPDGCVELVFNLADPFLRMTRPEIFERQSAHLVVGQMTGATMLRPSGRVDVWGVRLWPWAAATLLGVPGSALRDRIVPIDALDGAPTAPMTGWLSKLADASAAGRRHVLVGLLAERVRRANGTGPVVAHLVRQVLRGPDTLTVGSLAARAGLGARRVQLLFAEHVGLPPKLLFRIGRFQRALALSRRPALSWAGVALAAGYHDQSHFIRDCREFASCSPSRLWASDHDLTDSFLSD